MADNLLVVSAEGPEARIGVVENGRLAEYFLERKRDLGMVGNIYKARVQRVLPGMQAAFVALDPSVEKAAFLYGGDVVGASDDAKTLFSDADTDEKPKKGRRGKNRRSAPKRKIEELIKEGQTVMVQVVKDPMGLKGARVTGQVSLPGRYLVFMPMADTVGVSRRIASDVERKRVRKVVEGARPKEGGFIVRTAAEGATDEEIAADVDFLVKLWAQIKARAERTKAPALIYQDLDAVLRSVRDRLTDDIDAVVFDSEEVFERAQKFVKAFMPKWLDRLQLYDGRTSLFDHYGLEAEVRSAIERRVPLSSGGSLVIDQGEALTSIDINTGSFVGKKDLEETITKNNLEACVEVAQQLRLRNLGGIIVVDFVDMEKESNRKKVFEAFMKALEADHSRTNVVKISELGLVEMTRKRTRESLDQVLCEACPTCEGRGRLKTAETVAYEILHETRRLGAVITADSIVIKCHPDVAEQLEKHDRDYLDVLEKRFQKAIVFKKDGSMRRHIFDIGGHSNAPKEAPNGSRGRGGAGKRGGGRPGAGSSGSSRGRRGGRGRAKKGSDKAGDKQPAAES